MIYQSIKTIHVRRFNEILLQSNWNIYITCIYTNSTNEIY